MRNELIRVKKRLQIITGQSIASMAARRYRDIHYILKVQKNKAINAQLREELNRDKQDGQDEMQLPHRPLLAGVDIKPLPDDLRRPAAELNRLDPPQDQLRIRLTNR
jgi:hypothetical protein